MTGETRVTDMTNGSVYRHILTFMLPLMIGNLFQQFYNLVDSVVVGNYMGADALAAVGTCGSLSYFFFALSSGLAIGIGILASQYFGAGDSEKIRATVVNSVFILVAAGVTVSMISYISAPQMLHLLNVPESIFEMALTYLRVTSLGIVAVALYNGVAYLLRAFGDSKSPLYFLIMACMINIVLDILFVMYMNMGVYGVALATVISQVFSFVVSTAYAWKKVEYFRIPREQWKPDREIIRRCMSLGVPMALQNALISISTMVLQGVVNEFGETVMAAYTVVGKVEQLVHMPFSALGTAVTSFAGQNWGAGKTDRVKQGYKASCLMVLALSALLIPAFLVFSGAMTGCFVKDADVVAIGAKALHIECLFYFALGMIYIARGTLNGCGDASFSLINGMAEVVCRIVFASLLTRLAGVGYWGIWLTEGLTWTVTGLVCIWRYMQGKWKRSSLK